MEEKYMVNDILECSKNMLKVYGEGIMECKNAELRQIFQNLRNLISLYYIYLNNGGGIYCS